MADLIWAVLLLPVLGVVVNGLILSWFPQPVRRSFSPWVAFGVVAAAFVCALVIFLNLQSILGGQAWRDVHGYDWIEAGGLSLSRVVPIALRIDPLSVTMMLVVTGVGGLIHLFSIGYMADDERVGRYFIYLNLFMFSMLALVLANNYVLMFAGWEGVGLCSYLLIGFWFERISAAQAGKKAFLVNRVGDFGFLLAMFAVYSLTGTLVFNGPDGAPGALDQASNLSRATVLGIPALIFICLMFFLAATGKSAQLPLYLWLPDAMEGPTPVSALIHAATMVTAGVYLIARSSAFYGLEPISQQVVAWVGVLTALWAAIIAVKQYDIKRVLAYSTVSQLGFMFVAVGIGAYWAGIFHLVTHAFFKALMFLGAGAVMHALEGQLDMRKMGNIKKYMPVTFGTFALGWLAISGIPPFAGYFSKDAILEGAFERGRNDPQMMAVFGIGVFTAFLTAFYMTRMFTTVFLGSERIELGDEGHGGDAQEHGPSNLPGHRGHGESRHSGKDKIAAHAHTHDDPGHTHDDPGHGHTHDHGHAHDAHDHGHTHIHDDHGHGHGHSHAHVHPEQWIMNIPLIVLGILSVVGGFLLVNQLHPFLERVTVDMIPADAAHAAADGSHGEWHPWTIAMMAHPAAIAGLIAGILGVAAAFMVGTERFARGWSTGTERLLGIHQTIYEGLMHFVFVRLGTKFSEVLYIIDQGVIDRMVNFVGGATNYLAESLRTLQTGYVRNYALVMLAGAVFVVACFMIILQQTAR